MVEYYELDLQPEEYAYTCIQCEEKSSKDLVDMARSKLSFLPHQSAEVSKEIESKEREIELIKNKIKTENENPFVRKLALEMKRKGIKYESYYGKIFTCSNARKFLKEHETLLNLSIKSYTSKL